MICAILFRKDQIYKMSYKNLKQIDQEENIRYRCINLYSLVIRSQIKRQDSLIIINYNKY